MCNALAAGLVLATTALLCGRASAQARVRLETPPTIVGDGETHVALTLTTSGDARDLEGFTIDADAGTIGDARVVENGIAVDYVPPRVALPRDVHVAVAYGGVVRSAPVAIAVTPPLRKNGLQFSQGPLSLRAPAAIVLGQDGEATVVLTSREAPSLAVNVGTLSPPVSDGHGNWRVTYFPPEKRFPQLAVIAAAADGKIDWMRLLLHGVGRVETRTKPSSRVVLSLGDASFGPFRTDERGVATTPVVAPPGIHRGTTLAVDPLGNRKESPFDLNTPPMSRLTALCVAESVHLFVGDDRGAASDEARLSLRASAGAIGEASRVAPGHFVARWTHGDKDADAADIFASLAGDAASSASCRARVAEAPPVAIVVESARSEFVAGSGAVEVRARLDYGGKRGGKRVPIVFDADAGTVDSSGGDEPGVTRVVWRLPDRFDGKRQATLRAHTDAPSLAATLTLPLVPGAPVKVTLARPPRWLAADGSRAALPLAAVDAFGNRARTGGLAARAQRGSLAVRDDAQGAAVEYVAPVATRAVDDRVVVSDARGDVAGVLDVRLAPPVRPFSLGARLGWLGNFGKISSALVAVDADWHPRWLRRRLAFGVSAGIYPGSYRASDATALQLGVTGVPLLARIGYAQPLGVLGGRFGVYGGIGGGAVIARVSTSSGGGSDASTVGLGAFEAHAGADYALGIGRIAVELGFLYAPEGGGDIRGNFGGLAVTAGYRVAL
jgi:hypothetical protein